MKEFLHQHGVEFEAHDVAEVPEALDTIRAHTGGSVGTPAVIIGDRARIGFHRDWMSEELGLEA